MDAYFGNKVFTKLVFRIKLLNNLIFFKFSTKGLFPLYLTHTLAFPHLDRATLNLIFLSFGLPNHLGLSLSKGHFVHALVS